MSKQTNEYVNSNKPNSDVNDSLAEHLLHKKWYAAMLRHERLLKLLDEGKPGEY
jgi:hypothetical protein